MFHFANFPTNNITNLLYVWQIYKLDHAYNRKAFILFSHHLYYFLTLDMIMKLCRQKLVRSGFPDLVFFSFSASLVASRRITTSSGSFSCLHYSSKELISRLLTLFDCFPAFCLESTTIWALTVEIYVPDPKRKIIMMKIMNSSFRVVSVKLTRPSWQWFSLEIFKS